MLRLVKGKSTAPHTDQAPPDCTCGHGVERHGGADAGASHDAHTAGRCEDCDCEAYTKPGSMRAMHTRVCRACEHVWSAPAPTGDCPRCHSNKTVTVAVRNNGLKRV